MSNVRVYTSVMNMLAREVNRLGKRYPKDAEEHIKDAGRFYQLAHFIASFSPLILSAAATRNNLTPEGLETLMKMLREQNEGHWEALIVEESELRVPDETPGGMPPNEGNKRLN